MVAESKRLGNAEPVAQLRLSHRHDVRKAILGDGISVLVQLLDFNLFEGEGVGAHFNIEDRAKTKQKENVCCLHQRADSPRARKHRGLVLP